MTNNGLSVTAAFGALGDPTRRMIIEALTRGPATASDLNRHFPMRLPSLMQHLGILEMSGLLNSSKQGRVRTFRISPEGFAEIEDWLENHAGLYAVHHVDPESQNRNWHAMKG